MKFGKYQSAVLVNFPEEWQKFAFDYDLLKKQIREAVRPCGLSCKSLSTSKENLFPNDVNKQFHLDFSSLVKVKISRVQSALELFFRYLDEEVKKFTDGAAGEMALLEEQVEEFSKGTEVGVTNLEKRIDKCTKIIETTVMLEKFVFLCYTGMTKIMKKLDKNSGLPLHNYYFLVLSQSKFSTLNFTEKLSTLRNRSKDIILDNDMQFKKIRLDVDAIASLIPNSMSTFDVEHYDPEKKFLLTFSGSHGTDVIGLMLKSLAQNNCTIHDFALSRVRHNITFACVIPMPTNGIPLLQELQKTSREWNLEFLFEVIKMGTDDTEIFSRKLLDEAPYEGRMPYVATTFNQNGLSTDFLHEWVRVLLDEKISIEKMSRLSALGTNIKSVDFKISVPPNINPNNFASKIFKMSAKHKVDVSIQASDVFRKSKRLVVFDMDSTLIQCEVIDEIASLLGKSEEVKALTTLAMNGEINFSESLKKRVALFKGAPYSVINDVNASIVYTDGARELCKALKKLGFKLAVISGGFTPLASSIKSTLGLDYAFANRLEVTPDGKTLTGNILGDIIDAQRKAELLQVIAQSESISLGQVIAVGDGANDLYMLNSAGLGVAFNAKPIVQEGTSAHINQPSLINLLYILGYTDDEITKLISNCAD